MKKVTIVSAVFGIIFSAALAWFFATQLRLEDVWTFLPDNWDIIVVAAMLGLIMSAVAAPMPRDPWFWASMTMLGLLAGHVWEIWAWTDNVLVLIVVVEAVLFGAYFANRWFGEKPAATDTKTRVGGDMSIG